MFETPEASHGPLALVVLLVAITVIGIVDIVLDRPESLLDPHVVVDMVLVVVSLAAAVYLWLGWRVTGRSLRRTRVELEAHAEERDRWRRRTEGLLRSLGEATDELFAAWDLSPAERATAVMILKGHSHKRIARLTDRSERTVRQHAVAIYRKSGLGGRAAFSAFFLEELMLPAGDGLEAAGGARD